MYVCACGSYHLTARSQPSNAAAILALRDELYQQWIQDVMLERGCVFVFYPDVHEASPGRWVGQFPAAKWSIQADSFQAALAQLEATESEKCAQRGYLGWQVNAVSRHLQWPVEGVYELDPTAYQRTLESENPEQALEQLIALLESCSAGQRRLTTS